MATIKKFNVQYSGTVDCFVRGELVSANDTHNVDYWRGRDEIRKGRKNTYLVIAGSQKKYGTHSFAEHVYKIIGDLSAQELDIEGLNYHFEQFDSGHVGSIGTITFYDDLNLFQ